MVNLRNYKSVDVIESSNHLLTNCEQMPVAHCTHLTSMSSNYVNSKTKFNSNYTSSYINQKVPLVSKEITVKEAGGDWYNSQMSEAKKDIIKVDRFNYQYSIDYYKAKFRKVKQAICNLVTVAKFTYYRSKIEDCRNDSSN